MLNMNEEIKKNIQNIFCIKNDKELVNFIINMKPTYFYNMMNNLLKNINDKKITTLIKHMQPLFIKNHINMNKLFIRYNELNIINRNIKQIIKIKYNINLYNDLLMIIKMYIC